MPTSVPYVFANANGSLPLSQLDSNFASLIGLSLSTQHVYTASATLPTSQAGGRITINAAGVTLTLPAAGSLPAGSTFTFGSAGYSWTVVTSGTDVFEGGATSQLCIPNSQLVVMTNGGGVWLRVADTTLLSRFAIGNRKAIFTANGNFTVPAGITQIWVSGGGGGGGGGGGNQLSSSAQGAGGGGGYAGAIAIKTPISVTPGSSLSIVIGGGGAGGAGTTSLANASNGASGGTTTLSNGGTTLLSLAGGAGGGGATVFNTNYVYGGNGYICGMALAGISASDTFSGIVGYGGAGAGTPFGIGGSSVNNTNAGVNGGFCSGGGGGGSASNGGNGGPGILIIEW